MSGLQTFVQELLNLPTDQLATLALGAVISPAKLIAMGIGLYKALSLNYIDPPWQELADHPQEMEGLTENLSENMDL